MEASYEKVEVAVEFIKSEVGNFQTPRIGIICGSGLGGIGEKVTEPKSVAYEKIPGFIKPTVAGHKGQLLFGLIKSVPVVCMQGRFHGYEGIPYGKCAFPVRVMRLLGAEFMIVTSAAGGINPSFQLGDFMIHRDYMNLGMMSNNGPLTGENDSRFGPRFPPMSNCYDRELINLAQTVAKDIGQAKTTQLGCYAMTSGPQYETIAEIRALKILGADTVGMSTVPEVMVAHHCGLRVLALSMVTNCCVSDYESEGHANHAEVLEVAERRGKDMENYVEAMMPKIAALGMIPKMLPLGGASGTQKRKADQIS